MNIRPGALVLAVVVVIVIVWVIRRSRSGNVATVEPTMVKGHEASPFAGLAPEAQREVATEWIGCVVRFQMRHGNGFALIDGRRLVVEDVCLVYGRDGFGVLVTPDAESGRVVVPLELIMGVKG